eukprot:gene3392-3717_t
MSALLRTAFQRVTIANASASHLRFTAPASQLCQVSIRSFHSSGGPTRGFEDFYDPVGADVTVTAGRGWTAPDLRRKSFDDLHKLWYVLYKERNVLLSSRLRVRRGLNPVAKEDEKRYIQVKRSMAAIKRVIDERKKIDKILLAQQSKEESA